MQNEKCFFLMPDGKQIEATNESNHPDSFVISIDDTISYLDDAVAIIHTHPDQSHYLSTSDRLCQIQTQLPWHLHDRKYRPCQPLLGRTFNHGEVDCYTLMRDFYMLATGFDMPNFERNDGWWNTDKNLYLDNLPDYFDKVDKPQVGDVAIICLASSTPNHAAIFLDDGRILHHLPNRLSKRDIYGGYYKRQTHSYWRFKKWQQSDFTGICADLAINSSCM